MIDDRRFPSISDHWLRIFLHVVDVGSFTQAGRALGIGQPAVSHAIKRLESALGAPVLRRESGSLTPTPAGQRLCEGVRRGFETVDDSVRAFRRHGRDKEVRLSVSTPLATYWLMPRLAEFRLRHPDIELQISTSDTDRLVGIDDADLWIPLGQGPWPSLRESFFHHERIYPVAAPNHALAGPQTVNDDLIDADLLIHSERHPARFDWQRWFAAHEQAAPTKINTLQFSDYSLVVHAALLGQGVALGWHHIVRQLIDDGRLLRVGTLEVQTNVPFVVLSRLQPDESAAVGTLRDWLVHAAASPA